MAFEGCVHVVNPSKQFCLSQKKTRKERYKIKIQNNKDGEKKKESRENKRREKEFTHRNSRARETGTAIGAEIETGLTCRANLVRIVCANHRIAVWNTAAGLAS
jgi:hypothetical protein